MFVVKVETVNTMPASSITRSCISSLNQLFTHKSMELILSEVKHFAHVTLALFSKILGCFWHPPIEKFEHHSALLEVQSVFISNGNIHVTLRVLDIKFWKVRIFSLKIFFDIDSLLEERSKDFLSLRIPLIVACLDNCVMISQSLIIWLKLDCCYNVFECF